MTSAELLAAFGFSDALLRMTLDDVDHKASLV